MNDIKIIKSLEDSGVLIDRVTETEEGRFIGALLKPLAASIVQPVIFSVVRGLSGTGAKQQEDDIWTEIYAVFSRNNLPRKY